MCPHSVLLSLPQTLAQGSVPLQLGKRCARSSEGCFVQVGAKDAKAFRDAMHSSAKKSAELKHLIVDSSGNPQALQYFGLTEKDVPAILVQSKDDEKFIKKNAVPKDLEKFVSQYQVSAALCDSMPV